MSRLQEFKNGITEVVNKVEGDPLKLTVVAKIMYG
jgi:hypothetical protein